MLYTFDNETYPIYSQMQGYGFLKEIPQDLNQFPEFYGNFIVKQGSQLPNIFMADVEAGIYSISVVLRGIGYIFAQQRRLCAVSNTTSEKLVSFSLTTGDLIAGYNKKRYTNNRIILSFCGEVEVISIKITSTNVPVLWLAGDSTVTDQKSHYPYNPGTTYCGWGQMLPLFLSPEYALYNLADSGLTTDTFRNEGYYDILYERLKPNDYVFIQFGHNDQKLATLKAKERYYENLLDFITEIKNKHAKPVLITPIARNTWNCTTQLYNDLLEDYAQAVIDVANYANIPYIDLHKKSLEYIKYNGLEESKPLFHPGDYTHTNDYGAYFAAKALWKEVMEQSNLSDLKCIFTNTDNQVPFDLPVLKGWFSPPESNSSDSTKTGKITILEALQYVQKSYKYFSVNPQTTEPEEVRAARQNGYYLFDLVNSNQFISWKDWEKLLILACSGRYETVIKPELTFSPDLDADWESAVKYAQLLEVSTSGCIKNNNKSSISIAGS